jgi:CHAD domain-containing protein
VKAGKVKGLDPGSSLRSNAARIVRTRLEEMLSFGDAASEPGAGAAQHNLRIAAKRLRYVLEFTGDCFGPEADRARRGARDLQSVLGDIHDCDVMAPRVAEQVSKLDGGPGSDGLAVLATRIRDDRADLHRQFVTLWRGQRANGVWTDLERAAQKRS